MQEIKPKQNTWSYAWREEMYPAQKTLGFEGTDLAQIQIDLTGFLCMLLGLKGTKWGVV